MAPCIDSRKRETLFSVSSSSHPWRADCSNTCTSVLVKFFWSLIVMNINIDELDCPWHINLQFRSNTMKDKNPKCLAISFQNPWSAAEYTA